jgi:hypothetical protein
MLKRYFFFSKMKCLFMLNRGSQPTFFAKWLQMGLSTFYLNFLLITGLTYTFFYKCKYPSQNYHRDSWIISCSSENNVHVVLFFKLVFILTCKNTPFSSNHLMYKLNHTVFPALFQPIAGNVTMRYPSNESIILSLKRANKSLIIF